MTPEPIVKKAVVNATAAELWRLWTTREGLNSFFGRDSRVELKVGGAFEIYFLMENEYGLRGSEGCRILSFLPEKMLSFSWNAPPKFPEVRNSEYKTRVIVEFNETEGEATEVLLTHTGWPDDAGWLPVHAYFENAWTSVIESLGKKIL